MNNARRKFKVIATKVGSSEEIQIGGAFESPKDMIEAVNAHYRSVATSPLHVPRYMKLGRAEGSDIGSFKAEGWEYRVRQA